MSLWTRIPMAPGHYEGERMAVNPTVESLKADHDVRDMSQDLIESMDYGDPISTWFNSDGQPHGWFIVAAAEEYARRTGNRVDGKLIAEALHGLITE